MLLYLIKLFNLIFFFKIEIFNAESRIKNTVFRTFDVHNFFKSLVINRSICSWYSWHIISYLFYELLLYLLLFKQIFTFLIFLVLQLFNFCFYNIGLLDKWTFIQNRWSRKSTNASKLTNGSNLRSIIIIDSILNLAPHVIALNHLRSLNWITIPAYHRLCFKWWSTISVNVIFVCSFEKS